ncbi:MAG TPA: TetR/AcrR family transcriptional regulator [Candidatus Binataceae bacterium]|nr:TetR/AcrR family transcriptional regulator [Candidatus Binataceae bacterium]
MPSLEVSNERRQQILDAAEKVFARNGFAESRMDQIVEESQLSKGTIYWYFKSKDEIIGASLGRMFERSLQDVAEQIESKCSVVERIMTVARCAIEQVRNARQLAGVELEAYAMAARNPSMRRRVKGYFDAYIGAFARLIADGVEKGELRPVDPRKAAISGVALFEGLTMLWVVDPDFDFEEVLNHAAGLMLAPLLPNARSHPAKLNAFDSEVQCQNSESK